MDYKVLSPQFFFLSFVFIARFMNFSSFKEGKNHSFRPILYSCSKREIRWALFMGLKMAFHDDCLALRCFFFFSLSKFECKNVFKYFYEFFVLLRVSFIAFRAIIFSSNNLTPLNWVSCQLGAVTADELKSTFLSISSQKLLNFF